MQIIIYYMTCTGNTLCYLREVRKALSAQTHEYQLRNIINEKEAEIDTSADLYGFACPTHSFREPTAMKCFLKNLPTMEKQTPAFLFTSMEADSGRIFLRMKKYLKKRNFVVIDYLALSAPLNYTPILTYDPGTIRQAQLKKAFRFGEELPQKYRQIFEKQTEPYPEITSRFIDRLKVLFAADKIIKFYTGKIYVDKKKCTQCGKCEQICPDSAISLIPFPKINKKCTGCCACINNCPTNALDSKRTKEKFHYICKCVY